ncbi:MAG: FkbM family methyltransferase, partial [Desulfobacteraceae bacterium]|nr:FkbM family methyltransferase [Desulfobacteraceae bacterium]
MTIKPKVSVLLSVYDCEKFIEQALKSIYNQTYQDFEVVIVDDGSTDKTSDILLNMKDSRTSIYRNSENKGLTKSLNIGLKLCRGKYVARMDADDISLPQRFEKQVRFLDENPNCTAVGSWCARIDSNGKIINNWRHPTGCEDIKKKLLAENSVFHGSAMVRRQPLVEIGGYDEKYKYSQDYDLWLRLSEVAEIQNLGEYLYLSRSSQESLSVTRKEQQDKYAELAQQEALQRKNVQKSKMTSEASLSTIIDKKDFRDSALDYFIKAGEELNRENFSTAIEYMQQYRSMIDYSRFPRISNKTGKSGDIDVSVIIVTYNRTEDLKKCLESLTKQDDANFEVIVVDNGGSDFEVFRQYVDQYIKCPINFILSEGRNIGACCAKGKIIAFLDDDALVPSNYISSIKTAFKTYDIFGLRGKALTKNNPEANKDAEGYNRGDDAFPTFCDLEGNSAFLREAFLSFEGMDPLLFGHEGSDLTYRIIKKHGVFNKIIYWPETVIYHDAAVGDYRKEKVERYKLLIKYISLKHNANIFALRNEIEKHCLPRRKQTSEEILHQGIEKSDKCLKMQMLGSEYGGWAVDLDLIPYGSTVVSAGVGEDISFDLGLINLKNCRVIGIDPTEKARRYIENNKNERFDFLQKALYSESNKKIRIYKNTNPNYVSESITPSHKSVSEANFYEAESISIEDILNKYKNVSVLKMDIEGAEYEVLNSISKLDIPQICIEFHHFCTDFTTDDTEKCIKHLQRMGYVLAHRKDECGTVKEATFIHQKYVSKKTAEMNIGEPETYVTKDIPVILVCYNRPKHTLEVLKALREHNIKNIYIFSDAPKSHEDEEAVSLTRQLVQNIDWTKPKIIERTENLGLARNIVSAVDYVFEKYDRLILLEDDCVPQRYFFDFVHTCLKKYENNQRVFGISGYTVQIPDKILSDYPFDLYFCPRIGSWGWATWKRAWAHHEKDLYKLIRIANEKNIDLSRAGSDIPTFIESFLKGQLKDVWTLNWVLSVYINNGVYIYPTRTHISNIGTDGTGAHCGKTNKYHSFSCDTRPTLYPADVFLDEQVMENFKSYYRAVPERSRSAVHFLRSRGQKRSLKIAQISTVDRKGGAAKVAWMLKEGLKARGLGTQMFVGQKLSNDPDVKIITDSILDSNTYYKEQGFLYYDINSTFKLSSQKEFLESDAVHYHNLHGNYFNPFALSALTESKPSVWTLHDMQSMTGHCAYSFDCEKWQTGCGNCPHLEEYPSITKDRTAEMWHDKKLIYKESDFELIVPSQWLKNIVEKSILKDKRVHLIYNGIDESIYRPLDKQAIRKMFKIPPNAVIISFVAHGGLIDKRKGGNFILEAYRYFTAKYPNVFFICVGGTSDKAPTERFLQIPFVPDEEKLVQLYCASDIFLFPTLADNCPLVILEVMGCGVPIVSFNTGGIPELIDHGQTGLIAGFKNSEEFIKMTEYLVADKAKREEFSAAGRERLLKTFTLDQMVDKHITLYERLAEQGKKENY